MSLIGSLDEVKLADVLRLFAAGKKSGLLTVAAGPQQALVRFQKGAIVHASSGRLHGDDAVLDLFGWREGQLTFVPEERTVTPNVTRGVDALILDGIREGEKLHRMREVIPSDKVVFHMGPGPADDRTVTVGPVEWKVLRALDGVRDVREVLEATKLPRAEVLRVLFDLAEAGFLERVEVQKPLRVQSQGLFGKDSATVDERLEQEWMRTGRFSHGVHRVEVRSAAGRTAVLPVAFRPGLFRDVHLPRTALGGLGVRDGEDVQVRPVG